MFRALLAFINTNIRPRYMPLIVLGGHDFVNPVLFQILQLKLVVFSFSIQPFLCPPDVGVLFLT